ncbi:uncharacterized protein LOC114575130 [Exaiptasia diaphana]|uniref:Uncharacterized protein n=1 Tax=Exaiptasia diaphana TaxID=2652724 RepID=A0A913YJD9_EXADI|nr:uncharacterized protein LOC114575130 [Exaiptasia diaphana]
MMFGVTIILLLFASNLPDFAQGVWRDLTAGNGIWKDTGNSWSFSMPLNDAKWHYGPARIWTTPVNSDYYEITSKILTSRSAKYDCGHCSVFALHYSFIWYSCVILGYLCNMQIWFVCVLNMATREKHS